MNLGLRFALGLANMPDTTVADLDKSLPGMARLAALAKQLEPIIQRNLPAIARDLPEVERIVKAAWPDIVAATPTIQELIEFAKGKTTA